VSSVPKVGGSKSLKQLPHITIDLEDKKPRATYEIIETPA